MKNDPGDFGKHLKEFLKQSKSLSGVITGVMAISPSVGFAIDKAMPNDSMTMPWFGLGIGQVSIFVTFLGLRDSPVARVRVWRKWLLTVGAVVFLGYLAAHLVWVRHLGDSRVTMGTSLTLEAREEVRGGLGGDYDSLTRHFGRSDSQQDLIWEGRSVVKILLLVTYLVSVGLLVSALTTFVILQLFNANQVGSSQTSDHGDPPTVNR